MKCGRNNLLCEPVALAVPPPTFRTHALNYLWATQPRVISAPVTEFTVQNSYAATSTVFASYHVEIDESDELRRAISRDERNDKNLFKGIR